MVALALLRRDPLKYSIWSLPSRGRPKSMARFLEAYHDTEARCPVYVGLDRDDPTLGDYLRLVYPANWHVVIGDRSPAKPCNAIHEDVFRQFKDASCYGLIGDDVVPRTKRWDEELAHAAGLHQLAYGDDGFQGEALATHPCVGGELVRAIGWLVLPCVRHAFADTALHTIARNAQRLVYLPEVKTEHLHPLAGKAPMDATYQFDRGFKDDQAAAREWAALELPIIVERLLKETA